MTLKKIDYSKLVVYKIVCKDLRVTDIYVGSTTNFDQRNKGHKFNCNNINSKKYFFHLYQTIRNFGNWDNWTMVIVERCPCENSYDSRKIERFYYEQLNANLNTNRPLLTEDDRKNDNKIRRESEKYIESKKVWDRKYRNNHTVEIKEHKKQYYAENIDTIREDRKLYYEKNKDKLNEAIICSCGVTITRNSYVRHLKTFKHISKSKSLFQSSDEIIHA